MTTGFSQTSAASLFDSGFHDSYLTRVGDVYEIEEWGEAYERAKMGLTGSG
jgi:hypothetical protein